MEQVELNIVFLFVPPLVVLAVVALSIAQWGCRNGRGPMDRLIGGEPGRLRRNRSRWGRVVSVCVCLDVPPAFRFTLRREGLFDRLAKALRFAKEPQLAHGPFDAAFYLEAWDPLAARLLEGTEGLRARLATGLARVEERGARLRAISCSDGRLHIHLATLGMAEGDAESSAHEAATWLAPLVAAMRKVRVEPSETVVAWRRALAARLAPLIAFPLALTILVVVVFTSPGALWEARDLLPPALVAGGLALLAYVAWAWRRTLPAERHRRALEWLFLGWPAFVALAFLLLLALRTGKVLSGPADDEGRYGAPRPGTRGERGGYHWACSPWSTSAPRTVPSRATSSSSS